MHLFRRDDHVFDFHTVIAFQCRLGDGTALCLLTAPIAEHQRKSSDNKDYEREDFCGAGHGDW